MKIKINKIKIFFKKAPRALGKKAFLTSLSFIILSLILGGLVFYKYSILSQKVKQEIVVTPFQFQENNYQNILKIWQEREEKSRAADIEQYSDPFRVD